MTPAGSMPQNVSRSRVSSSGEIPWVIDSTGGGIVFEEANRAALREAIVELRDSPARREELGRRGQAQVQETFSVEAVGRVLHAALMNAVQAGAREPR